MSASESRYSPRDRIGQVVLACFHVIDLRSPLPERGDEQWCYRCHAYRFVGIVNTAEWAATCDHCTYGRRFGQSKDDAELAAMHHELKSGHRVLVYMKGV